MADLLLRRFPHEREGDLARRYSALVQAQTLAEIAQAIDLGHDMRLGDSEAQSGAVRPTILADVLEAVLGAIFLDAGFAAAAAFVERLWGERLSDTLAAPRDAKTALQEWAQARRLPLPDYREVGREGPAHAPLFVVEVAIRGHEPGRGRGRQQARGRASGGGGAARTAGSIMNAPHHERPQRAPASSPSSARPTPASRRWSMRWSARRSASSRPRCRPRACGCSASP